ncbi:MAG: hypothetical protein QOJ00_2993, partial [Actinomycetota bacterium]
HDAVPRRRWRWLLPLLVAVAVVALIATIGARIRRADASPEHAVTTYLNAVQHGKTRRAYDQLCDAFRLAVTYDSFAANSKREAASDGGVTGTHLARVESRANGQRLATYTVRRHAGDTVIDAALVNEHGRWRLCGFKPRASGGDATPGTADSLTPG